MTRGTEKTSLSLLFRTIQSLVTVIIDQLFTRIICFVGDTSSVLFTIEWIFQFQWSKLINKQTIQSNEFMITVIFDCLATNYVEIEGVLLICWTNSPLLDKCVALNFVSKRKTFISTILVYRFDCKHIRYCRWNRFTSIG